MKDKLKGPLENHTVKQEKGILSTFDRLKGPF